MNISPFEKERKPIEIELVYLDKDIKRHLSTRTKDVEHFDVTRLTNLHRVMTSLMNSIGGVGLSANQVGINESIFVANVPFEDEYGEYKGTNIFINPVICYKSFSKRSSREGCLSIPGMYPKVERSKQISLEFRGIDGGIFWQDFEGEHARIIQHEIDHLNGRTIKDVGRFV